MKRSLGVVLSFSLALVIGITLTHRAGDSPASEPPSAHVPDSASKAKASVHEAATAKKIEGSPGVAGSNWTKETLQQELTALRAEVALLRGEVSAANRQLHKLGRLAWDMPPRREEDPAQDTRPDPATRADAELEGQSRMEKLEVTFRHEPADFGWSFEAEEAVQEALARDDTVQHRLLGLECRSYTCRMELADDDTGALAHFLPEFLLQLAQTLPSGTAHHVDDGNGGKVMILYLSREVDEPPPTGK
jgi:hypothetical protein